MIKKSQKGKYRTEMFSNATPKTVPAGASHKEIPQLSVTASGGQVDKTAYHKPKNVSQPISSSLNVGKVGGRVAVKGYLTSSQKKKKMYRRY